MTPMDRGQQLRERLLGFRPTDTLWGWAGPLLFAAIGGLLRFWALDRPHQLVFDETYYVKQGVSMLDHGVEMQWNGDGEQVDPLFTHGTTAVFNTTEGDMVVHPPVGKWVIAFGEWVFGSTSSFGWRFSVALLGTISILMVGRIARRLFRSSWLGAIASFLMAFEGHHFVHSRTGLLDIVLMFFVLVGFWMLLLDRTASRRVLARKVAALYGGDRWRWGIRRPVVSATAPRIGASTAMAMPEAASPQPHSACAPAPACAGSMPSSTKRVLATSAK